MISYDFEMIWGNYGKWGWRDLKYGIFLDIPVALNIIPGKEYVLAIRYSNHKVGYNRNIDYGKAFLIFMKFRGRIKSIACRFAGICSRKQI